MYVHKGLKALNDTVSVKLGQELSGAVGVEYDTVGDDGVTASTGTVVVEARIGSQNWYPLKIHKNDETTADNLAAAGIGWVEASGWDEVRARLSVAGGAQGVNVHLNSRYP